jgi:hypothetical protein
MKGNYFSLFSIGFLNTSIAIAKVVAFLFYFYNLGHLL